MLPLPHEHYSRQEILNALHGKQGSRSIGFRFDLLDPQDKKIGDVSHLVNAGSSSIDLDNTQEIHRSAKFIMRDDGTVNFLSDRIQPWALLRMPGKVAKSISYIDTANPNLFVAKDRVGGYMDDTTGAIVADPVSFTSGFVPVTSGTSYTWQTNGRNRYKQIQFYDAAKAFISPEIYSTSTTVHHITGIAPANAAFMRVSSDDYADGFFKLEKGATVSAWSPSPEDIGMADYQANWMTEVVIDNSIPAQDIEFPLGVFLLSTPEKSYQNSVTYRSIEAYDKLQILLDDGFTARYVADEGEYVTEVITDIIQQTGVTQMNITRSEIQLPTWFSWDPDESRLEVVNQLLKAINYEPLYVDEYGYFTSRPYRSPAIRSAEYEYKTDAWSVISPGATALQDFFAVPNQWVGIISEPDRVPLTYTYENLNPDSPTSIPARGRTVTKYIDVDAADIESLQGIVQKQAFEDSQVYTEMTFQTALMPMHSHNDVYRLQHHKLDINAKFQELSWSMTLSAAATMTHRVREVITI